MNNDLITLSNNIEKLNQDNFFILILFSNILISINIINNFINNILNKFSKIVIIIFNLINFKFINF